ncbi:alpha/beta fold hydrolase [candidate division CSSED10-310 bacterium]|uniref:Alpha/beta fold hydrolase n=1 Tax=candidate division CSSED10-310 bacterium TaxID=2855610 RepID=A0ABV6YYC4_UNCC1
MVRAENSMIPDYEDVGTGKAVVFLPGMEGAKEFWHFQAAVFKEKYRAISCSYIRRQPKLSRTIAEYAADIIRLLDSLHLEKAAIIGESFGGVIAQELTLAYPQRVVVLVLCNTVDRARSENFGVNMFTLATFIHPLTFFFPKARRKAILTWVGKHRGFVMDPSPGNDQLAEYILEYGLLPGIGGYMDRIIAGIKVNFTTKLETVSVPTLIIRGSEDRIVGPKTVAELVGRIPGAELALINGGGHCCQQTKPEATNRAILEWLERQGY